MVAQCSKRQALSHKTNCKLTAILNLLNFRLPIYSIAKPK